MAATTPPAATDVVAPPAPSIVPTEPLAKNPVVVQEVASPEVQRGVMLMPVPRPPFAVETEPKPDLAQPKAL